MDEDSKLELAKNKMGRLGNAFPWAVRRFRKEWRGGTGDILYDRGVGFSGAWPMNREYEEYKFFDRCLEALIREDLVNPIFEYLFALYGIEHAWPKDDVQTKNCANKGHERQKHFEFIINHGDRRVAYLYADPHDSRVDVVQLQKTERLDDVLVIDWHDLYALVPRWKSVSPLYGGPIVHSVTIRSLLNSLFPEEVGNSFVACVEEAVSKANDIIGFHTIPSLSLAHLSDFKLKVLESLKRYDDQRELARLIIGNSTPWKDCDVDIEAMRQALFKSGTCDCLVGSMEFARCFVTSEYLIEVFKRGGEFDYTAVVCGYLKAVEQLAYALTKCTLGQPNTESLLIKQRANRRPANPNDSVYRWDATQVKFKKENEHCFDTTLTPLIYLLTGYKRGWRTVEAGRVYAKQVLLTYAAKDRNGYFHKDNISTLAKVREIRDESLRAILLLIGAYSAGMTDAEICKRLGKDNVKRNELGFPISSYDELYENVFSITEEQALFLIELENEPPFKAIRLQSSQLEERDQEGHVVSKIRFMRCDESDRASAGNHAGDQSDEGLVILSRGNMPVHVSYCWIDYRDEMRIYPLM